jgi:hypothetical protein
MNFARDLKTGRFIAHATLKEIENTSFGPDVEIRVKEKAQKAVAVLSKKTLKVKTDKHLKVYSTKKLQEKSLSKMRPGTEVIMDFLDVTAPGTEEQLVRVRKDGSTRTFYTTDSFAQEVLT